MFGFFVANNANIFGFIQNKTNVDLPQKCKHLNCPVRSSRQPTKEEEEKDQKNNQNSNNTI